ncbi:hypothetical protein OS493_002059 [Desmophyllum pertusum]|uniref:Uncharacterized protein n=1 Tax=Desmophyllum pertusum TaxID=174260 RepID=A0A9X0CTT3_9CNID|nr:hypothetical protein OS493_002059 [Desmophyllum pertusum]
MENASEAGPSGVSREEVLSLLDAREYDKEEDECCNDAMEAFERQRAFQSHLMTQGGSGLNPDAEGMFEFDIQPFEDRRSDRMGVHERHFITQLRQTNNFVDRPHLARAIQQGLRRAIDRVLSQDNLQDHDRLYFSLASTRLANSHMGYPMSVGDWRTHVLNSLSEEDMEAHDLMANAYPDYGHPLSRNHIQHAGNQETQSFLTSGSGVMSLITSYGFRVFEARRKEPETEETSLIRHLLPQILCFEWPDTFSPLSPCETYERGDLVARI